MTGRSEMKALCVVSPVDDRSSGEQDEMFRWFEGTPVESEQEGSHRNVPNHMLDLLASFSSAHFSSDR
jgi:hypothetical protein